jgi:hypothetical protein
VNRKALCFALFLAIPVWIAGCSSGTSTVVVGPPALVTVSSGTPQTAAVNTAFEMPLVALVSDNKGNPVPGVVVTFTAPASGATATFANGVNTAATNASGLATSSVVSANGTIGGPYTVTATVTGVQAPANFSLQNTAGTPATITATSGTPQSTPVNTAFGAPLVAQVLDSKGNPVSGVTVTFTAPSSGASVSFAGGVNTATTTSSGVATSPVVSANGTVGGPYTVTASVKGVVAPANFSLTNTSAAAAARNFTFYVSGLEANSDERDRYSIAGVFTVNTTNGQVLGGEQDYNDGNNISSPQPGGDKITGGSLTVNGNTGSARLILETNNPGVGRGGREAFAVQVVNANHALIAQDDGTAISSGSMDLQTLPSTLAAPTGAFAFSVWGVDRSLREIASGGIFKLTGNSDGTATLRGTIDTNDAGSRVLGTSFAAELSAPDSFGRGTITNNTAVGLGLATNYYIVGPEVIRLINVDKGREDSAVGSGYGQGTSIFGNHSLNGSSVFAVESDPHAAVPYAAAGSLLANNSSSDPANFTGVGDIDENGRVQGGPAGSTISGTYTIDGSGYGRLSITNENEAANRGLADVSLLGVYMVDPRLNINDPNNTTSGTGGALVVDLAGDGVTVGTGVLVPQTDTSTASFAGSYAFGGQGFFSGGQLESVASRALFGAGIVHDPFYSFGVDPTGGRVLVAGTPMADGMDAGRYVMRSPTPLTISIPGGESMDFTVVIYQASGTQLFWLDEDEHSLWIGPLEQQPPQPPSK